MIHSQLRCYYGAHLGNGDDLFMHRNRLLEILCYLISADDLPSESLFFMWFRYQRHQNHPLDVELQRAYFASSHSLPLVDQSLKSTRAGHVTPHSK